MLTSEDIDKMSTWAHNEAEELYAKGLVPSYLPPAVASSCHFVLGPVEDRPFWQASASPPFGPGSERAWLSDLLPYIFESAKYGHLTIPSGQLVRFRTYWQKQKGPQLVASETCTEMRMFWCEPWAQIVAWQTVKRVMDLNGAYLSGEFYPPFRAAREARLSNVEEGEKEMLVAEALLGFPATLAAKGMRAWLSQRTK